MGTPYLALNDRNGSGSEVPTPNIAWAPLGNEEPVSNPGIDVRDWEQQFAGADSNDGHPAGDEIVNRALGQGVPQRSVPL